MFKLNKCAENTYYLGCYCNSGVYDLGNGEVILIDSCDHKKSVKDLDFYLEQNGWTVKAIINTHCHLDHIAGNKYFSEKYGCRIYSSAAQSVLIQEPSIQVSFFFNGVSSPYNNDKFFESVKAPCFAIDENTLPKGFEFAILQGHTIDQIAVKTPDDVWFIGDTILAAETFESYKIPFFENINKSIDCAETISQKLKGSLFVPSHATPCESIEPLALKNAEYLRSLKSYMLKLCKNKTLEEILVFCENDLKLNLTNDKYAKISWTIKSLIQALIEDGEIKTEVQDGRLIYVNAK